MPPPVVFDLDKVLLGGDASMLFLRGALRNAPGRLAPLLLAAPLLLPTAAVPWLRPLAARAMTWLTVGEPADAGTTAAYRSAVAVRPEAAIAEAVACIREHLAAGERVVVATGCEERLARGFLTAIGVTDVDVVGSSGSLRPSRVRRAIGEGKVALLRERGYPPPWTAVYSDSPSDLPLFAGTRRPVLVNGDAKAAEQVTRVLGRRPEIHTWR
jgi:phosphatidylglycerophosphatase C